MNGLEDKNSLWHTTAQKLIKYASKFRYTSDEFERQVGYLLLDVGVETLFRSYLTMPDTKAKLAFSKREEAAKGTVDKKDFSGEKFTLAGFDELSFHKLVDAVRQVAEAGLNENDLKEAEHYHNIRNKIYHLGEGIVPAKEKFDGYLQLAERLLAILLNKNEKTGNLLADEDGLEDVGKKIWHEYSLNVVALVMQEKFQELQLNIGAAAEVFAPKYTSKRFEKSLTEIKQSFPDNEDDNVSRRYESQMQRIAKFKELMGNEIEEEIDFIDKVLNDITYLYLDILLSVDIIDDNDVANYIQYRNFVERFRHHPDDASREDREKILRLRDWVKNLEEKLGTLAPKQKTDSQKEEDI